MSLMDLQMMMMGMSIGRVIGDMSGDMIGGIEDIMIGGSKGGKIGEMVEEKT